MSCCGQGIIEQAAHGAVGLTKAALGIDRPPEEVIKARRDQCRECDQSTKNPDYVDTPSKGLTNFSRCLGCGDLKCFIEAKTAVGSEFCPKGKWNKYEETSPVV